MKLYLTLLLVVSAWCGANNSMFACGSSTTPNDVDEGSMFDALGAPEETEDVGAIGEVRSMNQNLHSLSMLLAAAPTNPPETSLPTGQTRIARRDTSWRP